MKNPFYHYFTPGFNWWYVIAVLGLVLVALVGYCKYYVYTEYSYRRLMKRYNDRFIDFASTVITIVLTIMVYRESFRGIVQFLDNGLAVDENPAWSVLLAPFMMLSIVGMYWTVLSFTGRFVSRKRKASLKRRLKQY